MDTRELWATVNRRLVAKIIAEASYEGCFDPTYEGEARYRLDLGEHSYSFLARRSIWDWLRINPQSLQRDGKPAECAAQLVVDSQRTLGMNDITLGNFLEELQNTLAADLIHWQRLANWSANELIDLPGPKLEGLLDGHPKALANKGRMGWGLEDLHRYSPESGETFQLHWLAVDPTLPGLAAQSPPLRECLDELDLRRFRDRLEHQPLQNNGGNQGENHGWALIPVHPWQWDHRLHSQYGALLAQRRILDLGIAGYHYRPQQSLRTLSNEDRPHYCDVKLALSILNTSCYRGIPGDAIGAGTALSQWLWDRSRQDPVLRALGLEVQREQAGYHIPHPHQSQVPGTPYRYREMLGAVWRESLSSKAAPDETHLLMAALMQCDTQGHSLVAALICRSGLAPEVWLSRLFDRVVIPLYHLLCQYGVGLVAHGQNLGLILRRDAPDRVAIKDFHGDLRCVDSDLSEAAGMPTEILATLKRLPAEHLVHDLITGHFVTTLRFISPRIEDECGLPETQFYGLLADRIRRYQNQHPELAERFRQFPLLRPTLERVCINRVRFRLGYQDHTDRPVPELGTPIANPLMAGNHP